MSANNYRKGCNACDTKGCGACGKNKCGDQGDSSKYSCSESCPSFSDIYKDESSCLKSKKHVKKHSSSSSSSSSCDYGIGQCRGCNKKCGKCNDCQGCGCGGSCCLDYSVSSVLSAVDASSSECCADLTKLADDCSQGQSNYKSYSVKQNQNKPKHGHSHEHKNKKEKKFMVSFRQKNKHVWYDIIDCHTTVWINGKEGPVLHLYRGYTYHFCIDHNKTHQALVLSTNPSCGHDTSPISGGFPPLSKGCASLVVNHNTPKYFYYGSASDNFCGGLCIVHNN